MVSLTINESKLLIFILVSSALSAELYKIEKMKRRHRMHTIQEKKTFLQNRNLPEPTLLVERPPSPDTLRKYVVEFSPFVELNFVRS